MFLSAYCVCRKGLQGYHWEGGGGGLQGERGTTGRGGGGVSWKKGYHGGGGGGLHGERGTMGGGGGGLLGERGTTGGGGGGYMEKGVPTALSPSLARRRS